MLTKTMHKAILFGCAYSPVSALQHQRKGDFVIVPHGVEEQVDWVHQELNEYAASGFRYKMQRNAAPTPFSRIRAPDDKAFAAQLVRGAGGAEKWIQDIIREAYQESVAARTPLRPDQDRVVEEFVKRLAANSNQTLLMSNVGDSLIESIHSGDFQSFQLWIDHLDEFYLSAASHKNAELWKECLKGHPLKPKPAPKEMSYANLDQLTSDENTTLHQCQLCSTDFVPPASPSNENDPDMTEVRITGSCQCGEELKFDKRDGRHARLRKLHRHYHQGCLQKWYDRKQQCPNCNTHFAQYEVVQVVSPSTTSSCFSWFRR